VDPDGRESGIAMRLDLRVARFASGEINREQFVAENNAEAVGGLIGVVIVVTAVPIVKSIIKRSKVTDPKKLKSIRTYKENIAQHQEKLKKFKDNPTIKPGMEKLPKKLIKNQQKKRMDHLKKEMKTFKNNIKKIKKGELES
jgi:hypothetical protein